MSANVKGNDQRASWSPFKRPVIVGATYEMFRTWLRENNLSDRDAIWFDRPEKIMGLELKEEQIVRLGPIGSHMEDLLRTRIR